MFLYNNEEYEITERNKLVNYIYGYELIDKYILVVGRLGKNADYYGVFNTETQEFEKDIVASKITYLADDIKTFIYCVDNKIFDFYGNEIKGYELADYEYIYEIYLDDIGQKLFVEIGNMTSDEELRIVSIEL